MRASFKFNRGQLITPPVKVEHKFSCRPMMAMDTAARITLITPQLAAEIGVDLKQSSPAHKLVGVGGQVMAYDFTIARISMLGMPVENIKVVCYPLSPSLKLDGILGLNFLQHFNLRIDNDNEKVTVQRCLE